MGVIKYRKIFYTISILLIITAFFGIYKYGLKLGIDFKGGTLIEVKYLENVPDLDSVKSSMSSVSITEAVVRPTGDSGFIIRTRELNPDEQVLVKGVIGGEIVRLDTVGPILGAELRKKAIWSIIGVLIAIILFITFAFRHVSRPVSSWKYGLIAIIALVHDVIIPTGVFAFLGQFRGIEIDSLFITALLVVLGFSIHDTIVVFDRTRENLRKNSGNKNFETIVGESVSQTFTRSINTSLTTILSLIVLYFVGPVATQNFVLALLIGIVAGTYSSIFVGSPLLVTWEKFSSRSKK